LVAESEKAQSEQDPNAEKKVNSKGNMQRRQLLGLIKIRRMEKSHIFQLREKEAIELIYPAVARKFQGNAAGVDY
jgi:hypothetical protein